MPAQGFWGAIRPPAGVGLDRGHPLGPGNGLKRLYLPGDHLMDVVSGLASGVLTGAASVRQDRHGRTVFVNAGGSDGISLGTVHQAQLPSGMFSTVLLGYHKTDNTARAATAFGNDTNGSIDFYRLLLPYSDGTTYFDYGSNAGGAGNRVSIGGLTFGDDFWAFTTGQRGMEIWQNGMLRVSNAVTPSRLATGNDDTNLVRLGAFPVAGIAADIAHFWYCAIYNRQLAISEIQSVTAAPYQMFAPPVWRRYFVPAAVAAARPLPPRDPQLVAWRGF